MPMNRQMLVMCRALHYHKSVLATVTLYSWYIFRVFEPTISITATKIMAIHGDKAWLCEKKTFAIRNP